MVLGAQGQQARHLIVKGLELDQILQGPEYNNGCMMILSSEVTVDDLILRNCGRDGFGMGGNNTVVRNSQVLSCGRHQPLGAADTKGLGFYRAPFSSSFTTAHGGAFENNLVDGCRGGGGVIHYHTADDFIVRNNVFRNFGALSPWGFPAGFTGLRTATGVNIGGAGVDTGNALGTVPGPERARIYHNQFYNISAPDQSTGHVMWGASNYAIYNNTYYNVTGHQRFILCYSTNEGVTVKNNILSKVPNETNYPLGCGETFTGEVSNNFNGDPLFVNAAGNDFHLTAKSPAIDYGTAKITDAITITGYSGKAPDAGYAEFVDAPIPPPVVGQTVKYNVSWKDNSNNEKGFRVEQCVGQGCTNFVHIHGDLPANTTTLQDTIVDDPGNRVICYRVKAFSGQTESKPTNTACVTTPPIGGGSEMTPPSSATVTLVSPQKKKAAVTKKPVTKRKK
jgi:hypothetical protein